MTKKAMKEKYELMESNLVEESDCYYDQCQNLVEKYPILKEAGKTMKRNELAIYTINIMSKDDAEEYVKLSRRQAKVQGELKLVREILRDL